MKLSLIIPYFGKQPDTFLLWLASAEYNPEITFLIFTDISPDIFLNIKRRNIVFIKTTFQKFVEICASKLKKYFSVQIENPYKLCDFRPAYGFILSEYLSDVDYWGYCDVDLAFGRIMPFIENACNLKYEKIYRHGHLTFIKNTSENNILFMKHIKGIVPFEKVIKNSWVYHFDENGGINQIYQFYEKKIFDSDDFADIDFRFNNLLKTSDEHSRWCDSNDIKQVYRWSQGCLKEYQIESNHVNVCDKIYIHLQKRDVNIEKNINFTHPVIISSKGIFNYDGDIDKDFINKYTYERCEYTKRYKVYIKTNKYRFFTYPYIRYKIDRMLYT